MKNSNDEEVDFDGHEFNTSSLKRNKVPINPMASSYEEGRLLSRFFGGVGLDREEAEGLANALNPFHKT